MIKMATIPLTITIIDYRYSANITVPSGTPTCIPPQVYNPVTGRCETPVIKPAPCPQLSPPLCPDGTLIPQPNDPVTGCPRPPICQPKPVVVSQETRIVRILPEGERKLPDANSGETVKITATVVCKTADTISKPRDTAYLIIDGAIADRKTIENGIVTFDWEATAVPMSIHNICVKVDPSANCKSPGQDCKRITVSPKFLSIEEQLAKERASSSEQRKLLEQARSRLREEIIGAELQVPGSNITTPYIPSPYLPPVITAPPTPGTPLPEPTQPDYGDISIVGLPALILPITPEIPIYIYIDDKNIGRLYELPKTVSVTTGTHTVYARGGDITTPAKTAFVTKDKTTNVTL